MFPEYEQPRYAAVPVKLSKRKTPIIQFKNKVK